MAWVSRADRFSPSKNISVPDSLGPGAYVGHGTYEVEPSYAPFGTGKVHLAGSKVSDDVPKDAGPPPGAYDPKLPKAYDSGLPAKKAPFGVGGPQRPELKVKGVSPGPGEYAVAAKPPEKQACRGMGAPQSENRSIFRSTSAPSIPTAHQCYGYEESGDGRLIRQGRRDGGIYFSGKPDDCCAPGHYDYKMDLTRPRVVQGKIIGARHQFKPATEIPGPGHYAAAKEPVKKLPMYSAFASEIAQTSTKREKTVEKMPGPGQYNLDQGPVRPDLRELHPELQYFGSTAERFKDGGRQKGPDPGSYSLAQRAPRFSKPTFGTCGRFQGADKISVADGPGPGAYTPLNDLAASTGALATASILGSTGSLAFGSMESKRGFNPKAEGPGPGVYKPLTSFPEEESGGSAGTGERTPKPRMLKKPSAAFKSDTARDAATMSYVKEGLQKPPPGAYDPIHRQDAGAVMRLPPKNEGFLSAGPQRAMLSGKAATAPGPGRYDFQEVSGGKKGGSFNRTVFEGVPSKGRPKGLGFSSQDTRFKAKTYAKSTPGPGAYNTDPDWNTKTYNIHFGDLY